MSAPSRQLALTLGSLVAFAPLAIDMYLPGLSTLAADLGAEPARGQQTVAAFFLGMGFGQLIYGTLADRLGRRRPLMVGIALFVLASIGCALAGSIESLILWRFVQALGGCAGMVIGRAVVRDRTEGEASVRLMSAMMMVMGLAPIVAPMLGSAMLGLTGWRGIFWFLAAYGAAMLAVVLLALPESLPAERRRRDGLGAVFALYRGLLLDRRFIGATLAVALPAAGMFAYIAGSSLVMMDIFGLTPAQYGLFFGVNAAGMVVMSQFNARLSRAFAMEQVLDGALLIGVLAALAMVAAALAGLASFLVVATGLFVFLAMLGCVMPMASTLAMAPHGRVAGSASALMGVVQFGAGALSGSAVGLFYDGSAGPMVMVMLCCGLGGLLARRFVARPAMASD